MLLVMLWKNILYSNIFKKAQSLAFSANWMIQCLHFSEILAAENRYGHFCKMFHARKNT